MVVGDMEYKNKEEFWKHAKEVFLNDFKLEHTKIDNILFYDDAIKNYFKATIELFGKCYIITTYNNKGEKSQPRNFINSTGDSTKYKIIEIKDSLLVLDINGTSQIKVNYNMYLHIKEHFDKINAPLIDKAREIADVIKHKVDTFIDEKEIIYMFNNYIDRVSAYYFQNPLLIIQVEILIAYKYNTNDYYLDRFLFQSDEVKRALHSKIINVPVPMGRSVFPNALNTTQEKLVLENDKLIVPYFNNNLKLLFKIVQAKFSLSENESVYLTINLLYRLVAKRYASDWSKEYGQYYDNIFEMDLNKAVETYFSIDTINHDNLNTVSNFVHYLMDKGRFKNNGNYLLCHEEFLAIYKKAEDMRKTNFFKNTLQAEREASRKLLKIDDIDLMNGIEFEQIVANIFSKLGYRTSVTKKTGDQGIDIIAEKDGTIIGIQAKNYSSAVSNSAIQEVVAGLKFYQCNKGIVVTNNFFTNSASALAQSNGIVLWDRNILKEKLNLING
jgi:HJR/Mrr/RecB family endonuclease